MLIEEKVHFIDINISDWQKFDLVSNPHSLNQQTNQITKKIWIMKLLQTLLRPQR